MCNCFAVTRPVLNGNSREWSARSGGGNRRFAIVARGSRRPGSCRPWLVFFCRCERDVNTSEGDRSLFTCATLESRVPRIGRRLCAKNPGLAARTRENERVCAIQLSNMRTKIRMDFFKQISRGNQISPKRDRALLNAFTLYSYGEFENLVYEFSFATNRRTSPVNYI